MDWFPGRLVEIGGGWALISEVQEQFDICQAKLAFVGLLEALPGGQIPHRAHDVDFRPLVYLE